MKINRTKTISTLVLLVMIIIGCSSDDPNGPTNKELAFEKLAGNWTYGTSGQITLDGQDVSLNYPGFTLSFTDGTYTTINGGDLFRATGTWAWANEAAGSINLDTGEEVTILELSVTNFKFSFTHTGGGVAAGTSGSYTVSLEK
tara:strand:+ start:465 stop:896 length:432 start_codon:yes stop_codon:yes gene_type:complete